VVPLHALLSVHVAAPSKEILGAVLTVVFPKLRPLYAICIGAADIGLVLLNLYFISDVVVGTFVGSSVGLFTVALFQPNAQFIAHAEFDVAPNGPERVSDAIAQRLS
jgi:membrane-associated phospholipid phosphatase